jgi:hypothetical protein
MRDILDASQHGWICFEDLLDAKVGHVFGESIFLILAKSPRRLEMIVVDVPGLLHVLAKPTTPWLENTWPENYGVALAAGAAPNFCVA